MNAQQIASQGRYGDNTLVHASAGEVQGLDALSRSIYGHKLPRNPQTGLPEAFLFAPFLAPLLAGGLGVTGAIGTGLLAGGLGFAEAAARGMDDPLQRGIMAGLTGGAAAGIGNALSAAGGAGTQAALQGAGGAGATGSLTSLADISSGAYKQALQSAAQPTTQAAMQATPAVFAPNPAMMAAETAQAASPGFMQGVSQAARGIPQKFSQMGKGIESLMQPGAFQEGGVGQTFLQQAKVPAIAGSVGLMGQSALNQQQSAQDAMAERERENELSRARSMGYISNIAQQNPFSMAGQAYYNPFRFAEGGAVNLFSGGAVRDYDDLSDEEKEKFRFGAGLRQYTPSFTQSSGADEFMRQLQLGKGNVRAGQISGYTGRYLPATYTSGMDTVKQAVTASAAGPRSTGSNAAPANTSLSRLARSTGMTSLPEGKTAWQLARAEEDNYGYAGGGYLDGGAIPGDGMSDSQPAMIDNQQPAALSSGEFVVPADVVSGLGNGSSDAGAQQLYAMMDRIRKARTGTTEQAPAVNPNRMMVA